MKPDSSQGGGSQVPKQAPGQGAAADLIRQQIDSLYGGSEYAAHNNTQTSRAAAPQQTTPQQAAGQQQPATNNQSASNPFGRTYAQSSTAQNSDADQWKAYHSAWQNYYQQYYELYYQHQNKQQKTGYFSDSNASTANGTNQNTVSKNEAIASLRKQLLDKVQQSAKKARKSRHFMPIAAAFAVVLVFVFLQYNRVFIAGVNAYVSPGAISPQNIVVNPLDDNQVSPEPRLIIPKINVDAPVVYGIGYDNDSQMAAMEKGVAHFAIPGANSKPGEIGNTVLSGHSSNDLFDSGNYKFIFAQLDRLVEGDTIYANYEGVRYAYVITKKEVVKPNEVNKLIYKTDKPVMTLITCTPLGTALNRLLVTAEQVSPDPSKASQAPEGSGTSGGKTAIPGNSPTFLEKLFGAN